MHDQGEVFIINEGDQWSVQFNIPAINAFGFEHRAENSEQQASVTQFTQIVQNSASVVSLDGQCQLASINENIDKQFAMKNHDVHEHSESEHHDHDDHKHHDKHEQDDHDKHEHHDNDKHKHDDHDKHKHDGHNKHEHDDHDKHEHHDHDKHNHDGHNKHEHDDHDKHEHHDHDKHNHADAEFSYVFNCDSEVSKVEIDLFKSLATLTLLEAQWIIGNSQGAASLTPQATSINFK